MTVTRTPTAVIKLNIRTPTAPWLDRPGHLVSYGKNASSPTDMRVPGHFEDEQVFQNHRTPAMPPIQIATPSGLIGACSEGSEVVSDAVFHKAGNYLAKLPTGAFNAFAIKVRKVLA